MSTKTADPTVTGAVAGIRASIYRIQNFWERHRVLSAVTVGFFLIVISYYLAVAPAEAAQGVTLGPGSAIKDSLKPLKDAAKAINGPNRGLIDSVHFLAWNRWTGFTPSTGAFYLTSAGSAAAVVTNTVSSLFFVISGFVLRMLGLTAAVGLSFDGVESVMDMITKNFVSVGSLFFPPLRTTRDNICATEGGCDNLEVVGNMGNTLPLIALLLLIGVVVMIVKRNGLPGSKASRRTSRQTGSLLPSANLRQIGISVGALLAISMMSIAGAAEIDQGMVEDVEDQEVQQEREEKPDLSERKVIAGSPRWIAEVLDNVAVWVGSAIGEGTELLSVALTTQSMKTGAPVGSACSSYIGTLHMVYQNGTKAMSNRDQFLVALDELALNSYFRLVVNSSYGDITDSYRSGVGNSWCHALEMDSGISGAEHMLMTRLSLAVNALDDEGGILASPLDMDDESLMEEYPLAYSIDQNLNRMLSGDALETFIGLKSMQNMWGPYVSPQTSNQAKFYFAACSTSFAGPRLLKSWSQVISADAIKVGPATWENDEGNMVTIGIGGTVQEKIYLEGSETIGALNKFLKTRDEGESSQIGICGGIPLGVYVRDPQVDEAPDAISLWNYVSATVADNTIGKIPMFRSNRVENLNTQVNRRNLRKQETWQTEGAYQRSSADTYMVSTNGMAENLNLYGSGDNTLYQMIINTDAVDLETLNEGKEIDGVTVVSPVTLYNHFNNYTGNLDRLTTERANIIAEQDQDVSGLDDDDIKKLTDATKKVDKNIDKEGNSTAWRWLSVIPGADWAVGKIGTVAGWGSTAEEVYSGAEEADQAKRDERIKEGLAEIRDLTDEASAPEYDLILQGAVSRFTPGALSISNALNWREPDVEFLGLGIKKMSSAAPLFVNAIDSGPYDYYHAIVGGNTAATFISSVFSLILAIALAYGIFPLIAGIVLSKFLAILAWFFLPFILLLNIWPSPKFRSLLKITVYSILWSYFSVVIFLAILKATTFLIILFTSFIYDSNHPVIIQTLEIMVAILASFAIITTVMKNYLKIDLTSLKGALTGAAMVSGTAVMDSLGKKTGILKEGETGDLDDLQGSFKNIAKGVKDKFTSPDTSKQEAEESEEASQKVLENKEEEADLDEAEDRENKAIEAAEEEEGGETAKAIAASLQSEGTEGPELQSSEEVAKGAKEIAAKVDRAGATSVDGMPENTEEMFDANSPEIAAALAEGEEGRDGVTAALSNSELLGGGDQGTGGSSSLDPLTGKEIAVQDAHTAEGGNSPLSGENAFSQALMESGSMSQADRDMLTHAASISNGLNSQKDVSTMEIPPEAMSWMEGNSDAIQSLLSSAGVSPVNTANGAFAGGASTNSPMSIEEIEALSHGAGFINDQSMQQLVPDGTVTESAPSLIDSATTEAVLTRDTEVRDSLENIANLLSESTRGGGSDPYSFSDLRGDLDGTVGRAARRVRGT